MVIKMNSVYEIIRANLKKYRAKNRVTQAKLAEDADISHDYLRQIESGIRNPSIPMLKKLADALHVELWKMFKE